jgi:hypothetical protein
MALDLLPDNHPDTSNFRLFMERDGEPEYPTKALRVARPICGLIFFVSFR